MLYVCKSLSIYECPRVMTVMTHSTSQSTGRAGTWKIAHYLGIKVMAQSQLLYNILVLLYHVLLASSRKKIMELLVQVQLYQQNVSLEREKKKNAIRFFFLFFLKRKAFSACKTSFNRKINKIIFKAVEKDFSYMINRYEFLILKSQETTKSRF